jgi:hypothetical protein
MVGSNMRYCFAALAVGKLYEEKTAQFFKDLSSRTTNCDFYVTTTNDNFLNEIGDRLKINVLKNILTHNPEGYFNYSLKVLSLKHVIKQNINYDFVIYCDADWSMSEGFNEEKLMSLFKYMAENNIDWIFERPHNLGVSRRQIPEKLPFFYKKLVELEMLHQSKWDEAEVVNEQFFVFKYSNKFKFFAQRWEMFLWYCIANGIGNYPDGLDIGISALEADMKFDYMKHMNIFSFIHDCFYFYAKFSNTPYYRFDYKI